MTPTDKPLVWLHAEIKTPPFSTDARIEAGFLLRRLERGERIGMPHSRSMSSIAPRCHELRITDRGSTWRIVYRVDPDAVIIVEVFAKRTRQTPRRVIDLCRKRLGEYDHA